jgi:hypothetical protein
MKLATYNGDLKEGDMVSFAYNYIVKPAPTVLLCGAKREDWSLHHQQLEGEKRKKAFLV